MLYADNAYQAATLPPAPTSPTTPAPTAAPTATMRMARARRALAEAVRAAHLPRS